MFNRLFSIYYLILQPEQRIKDALARMIPQVPWATSGGGGGQIPFEQPFLCKLEFNLDIDAATSVPDPATLLLFGISLLGLAGASRRKKY